MSKRVLVTWGSRRGGTEGIARIIADELAARGHDVHAAPASTVKDVRGFDAVVVGGALYANGWHKDARGFLDKHARALRRVPVWTFSSGPLDDSADTKEIPPVPRLAARLDRVGAVGHTTFGGRLDPDAGGFTATHMAREHKGDWRNPARIRAWANALADALPSAAPGMAKEPAGRSLARLVAYGLLGSLVCAATLVGTWLTTTMGAALVVQMAIAPFVFVAPALLYFRSPGAREPGVVALTFGALFLGVQLAVVTLLLPLFEERLALSLAVLIGGGGAVALVIATTWLTGAVMGTLPWSWGEPQERPVLRERAAP